MQGFTSSDSTDPLPLPPPYTPHADDTYPTMQQVIPSAQYTPRHTADAYLVMQQVTPSGMAGVTPGGRAAVTPSSMAGVTPGGLAGLPTAGESTPQRSHTPQPPGSNEASPQYSRAPVSTEMPSVHQSRARSSESQNRRRRSSNTENRNNRARRPRRRQRSQESPNLGESGEQREQSMSEASTPHPLDDSDNSAIAGTASQVTREYAEEPELIIECPSGERLEDTTPKSVGQSTTSMGDRDTAIPTSDSHQSSTANTNVKISHSNLKDSDTNTQTVGAFKDSTSLSKEEVLSENRVKCEIQASDEPLVTTAGISHTQNLNVGKPSEAYSDHQTSPPQSTTKMPSSSRQSALAVGDVQPQNEEDDAVSPPSGRDLTCEGIVNDASFV